MDSTYTRFLKATLLALMALTLAFIPETGLAKKKAKAKKAEAAEAAAPADDAQAKAREHYTKGKELYEAQDYAGALTEFQGAYDIKPHPTVLKSIAECKLQTGDILGAIETLEKVLADPLTTDTGPAQTRLDEVRAMMATLEVVTTPEGAGIMLDGSPTDKVAPVILDVTPGDHELALNVEGYEPMVKNVTLANGEKGKLDVNFEEEGVSTNPEPALADPFASEGGEGEDVVPENEKEGPPPAFWVSAAVAGVGLVAGTVFGTMALGDEDDFKANPDDSETQKSGKRNAIIADVSFGVAAAAAVVGVVILLTNKGDEGIEAEAEAETAKWSIVPVATGDTFGVSSAVSF